MKTWSEAMQDGAVSGSVASILSTAVLAATSQRESNTPYAATNAISHWFWGDHAGTQDGPSMRYTAVGYAIHHASATLWGILYEKWFGDECDRKEIGPTVAGAVAVASLACFVDYKLTPYRLQPGFEKRLSKRSLFLVYATFGAALVLRGLATPKRRPYVRAFPLYQ